MLIALPPASQPDSSGPVPEAHLPSQSKANSDISHGRSELSDTQMGSRAARSRQTNTLR